MNRFILFSCAALSLALVAGCKKGAETAAVVNGEPITLEQFNQYLLVKPQVQIVVDPAKLKSGADGRLVQQPFAGPVIGSLGLQALSDLIQQTVVKQLAKDQGVSPTEDQVKAELADRTKADPKFVQNLTNAGFTLEMIRNDIATELANFNLTTQGITVTDDEIHKYIAEHPKEFIVPESVDMIWMLVPDDKTKKAADADLKSGRSFITVAQSFSIAPNARQMQYHFQGPAVPMPSLVNYGPDLLPAVQKTKEEQQTDWIKFTEGWAKFFINKKMPERKVPIDDALIKNVRRALMQQRGAQGKDVNARIAEKLKASKIDIGIPTLKDPWQHSMESLQAGTATTGPGANTAPNTKGG